MHARLLNQAKASQRPFQEVLQHYGLERLLYRLAQSQHRGRFLLKGALLLTAWSAPLTRPTRDIDLLGYAENDVALMETMFREVCDVDVVDDGLRFDAATVVGQRIKEDADYQGVRLTFLAFLGKARIPIQIDIGFGDVVNPGAEERDYPTLLDVPAAHLRMYPRETVIAEKFEAMVKLGTLNTRMKDFFDIWLLASQFSFTGPELAQAIEKTFANRGTPLEADPVALTPSFMAADGTQKQWAAFLKRSQLDNAPKTLDDARDRLRNFLVPVATALVGAKGFSASWTAPGPWQGA
ncbi:MAG TPA: nucleotidyl transferase AbiEii/AbiGii toxin family protein [Polyangiaceae bacterium]|nr:nucleotidyl transferase AbiEii/AbiGii toxin family protein [Polyangiaceae bacterium]